MLEANETIIKPSTKPNKAPAANVKMAAPGKDKAVTRIYKTKKPPITNSGDCSRHSPN